MLSAIAAGKFNIYDTSQIYLSCHLLYINSYLGFVSSTATNPIWFVKTRLQLNNRSPQMSAMDCCKQIYRQSVSANNFYNVIFLQFYEKK